VTRTVLLAHEWLFVFPNQLNGTGLVSADE
jgi:hypothetical protein